MAAFNSDTDFESFERHRTFVRTFSAVVFVGALLYYMLCSPHGPRMFWCVFVGATALVVCFWASYKLRAEDREAGLLDALDLIGDGLSIGDSDD